MYVRRLSLLALMAIVLAGCSVQLRTAAAPANACDLALVEGRLVADARSGIVLAADAAGPAIQVVWPYGYSARRDQLGLALLDERGIVVAREGDIVNVGGGAGGDGAFVACAGTVTVVQPPGLRSNRQRVAVGIAFQARTDSGSIRHMPP